MVLAGGVAVALSAPSLRRLSDDDHPGTDITYTLSVDKSTVSVGDTVTVTWTGSQSHPSDWQDWDWIAAFQAGACNGSSPIGQDTCYGTNQWAWVSDQGSSASGSWSFSFDGPGTYEFRVSYCGCDECNDITEDFAACDGYMEVGISPTVTVTPPFDLSPYSPDIQFVLGVLWQEFEGADDKMNSLLSKPGPDPTCNTCLCSVQAVYQDMESSYFDFEALWNSFSMAQLETTMKAVASTFTDMKSSLTQCDVDAIMGSDLVEELVEMATGLVDGLEEVETVVKMTYKGENIYSFASNCILGWRQGNWFSSGVNAAKLINLLLSVSELNDEAQRVEIVKMAPADGWVMRRPGGAWVPCTHADKSLCFNVL